MRKRPKIGDIIEIETSKGFAYAQYTHKDPKWGGFMAIFKGLYKSTPDNFHCVLNSEIMFRTYFPLGPACNRNIVRIISNEPIPEHLAKLPLFIQAGFVDREGKVHNWFLRDGEKSKEIKKFKEEHFNLPVLQVINDTLLIERIENDWCTKKEIERRHITSHYL